MAASSPNEPDGSHVDYRFLLANERTFLAWVRTSLGFIAGGVALDQFVYVAGSDALVSTIAVLAILSGGMIAVVGTVRWTRADDAMRSGRPLTATRTIVAFGIVVVVLAGIVALLMILR